MMKCPDCNWTYPEYFLNELVSNMGTTLPICGICALERTNRLHKIQREKFDGEVAEEMRQRAIRWRKNRPEMEHK